MNDFQIDLGDLMPGFTGAVSEAELCDECDKDIAEVDGLCADCARELEAA